ncbi:MAG: helix-turn-helix transcriptional regulator [Providencia heimbachae]|nr:helix-turn-helix transcriptional regulator [Providencia heimbachae]
MSSNGSISKLVGLNLKQLRMEAGLTACQLAKMSGIKSEQQMYRYERGISKIGIAELVAALKVLNVNIGEFFNRLNEEVLVADEPVDIDSEKYYSEAQVIADLPLERD